MSSAGPWRSRRDPRGHAAYTVRDREVPGFKSRARRWLSFIALHLNRSETLDLAWWRLYHASNLPIFGFGVGFAVPVLIAALGWLGAGLEPEAALLDGLSAGLAYGLVYGLVSGFVASLLSESPDSPVRQGLRRRSAGHLRLQRLAGALLSGIGRGL